jgi:hypothetical protein
MLKKALLLAAMTVTFALASPVQVGPMPTCDPCVVSN